MFFLGLEFDFNNGYSYFHFKEGINIHTLKNFGFGRTEGHLIPVLLNLKTVHVSGDVYQLIYIFKSRLQNVL